MPRFATPAKDTGQVVAFPGRALARLRGRPTASPAPPSPVDDVGKYENGAAGADDYRHRMLVNAAALAFCVVLVIVGVWIAREMAAVRKTQDCVLHGRSNCAQVNFDGSLRAK